MQYPVGNPQLPYFGELAKFKQIFMLISLFKAVGFRSEKFPNISLCETAPPLHTQRPDIVQGGYKYINIVQGGYKLVFSQNPSMSFERNKKYLKISNF